MKLNLWLTYLFSRWLSFNYPSRKVLGHQIYTFNLIPFFTILRQQDASPCYGHAAHRMGPAERAVAQRCYGALPELLQTGLQCVSFYKAIS